MFPYASLPETSFRLLRLAPSEKFEGLVGTLEIYSLDSHPPYESLSYSWGTGTKTYGMSLDGTAFSISGSVISALWRLRQLTQPRLLWIDAICINQDDLEERAAQVIHMSRIYTQATCVLCYMGEDNEEEGEDSGMVIDFIKQIGDADFSHLPSLEINTEFMAQQGLPARHDPMWIRLLLFFERDWFRRCWVVQEFVAGAECTLIVGKAKVSWKVLRPGFEKMLEYGLMTWGLGPTYPAAQSELASVSMALFRTMLEIKSMGSFTDMYGNIIRSFSSRDETAQRELVEGSWNDIVPGTKHFVETIRSDPESGKFMMGLLEPIMNGMFSALGLSDRTNLKFPLLKLLTFFLQSVATDPRDKLYAFLSMSMEKDEPELRPDYTQSVEQVYMRYTKYLLKNNPHNLTHSLLLQAGWRQEDGRMNPTQREELQLPSWVPDFSVTANPAGSLMLTMPAGMKFGYKACGDTTIQVRIDEVEENVLHIKGSRLGTITRIAPHLSFENLNQQDPAADFVDYFDKIDAMFLLRAGSYPWTPAQTANDVLWRTMIGNVGARPFFVEDCYGKHYAEWREVVEDMRCGDFPMDDVTRFEQVFHQPWVKRWVTLNAAYVACETDLGLLGLVPKVCKAGDEICLFLGGDMPSVLRTVDGNKEKHELIGGCYMHGIMEGESVGAAGWKEEEFHLQ